MSAKDRVRLSVGGRQWSGFTQISVARGIERTAADFSFGTSLKAPAIVNPILIRPLTSCVVKIDTELVLTGFVDSTAPSFDAGSSSAGVNGRSRTGDLVDCSATAKPASWFGLTVAQIAASIAKPYSITVRDLVGSTTKIRKFRLEKNEKCIDAIQRLAALDALLVTDNEAGDLVLTRVGSEKSGTVLELGSTGPGGILSGSAVYAGNDLYSELRVKGQSSGSNGASGNKLRAVDVVGDPDVGRFRLLTMDAPGKADRARCREVARWEQARRLAKSIVATVSVRGWRQRSGDPQNRCIGIVVLESLYRDRGLVGYFPHPLLHGPCKAL